MNIARIEELISKIDQLQVKTGSGKYNAGLFPSQRSNQFWFYRRDDSNIYFPTLVAFTLLTLVDKVSDQQKQRFHKIIDAVIENYPQYKCNRDLPVYNFYQTNPQNHYPNGFFFSKFKHFKLAEDADDTCIIAMTLRYKNQLSETAAKQVKVELVRFSNLNTKEIASTLPGYRHLKAYGVWFGTGRMPIEFDFCVMANTLCFVVQNQLPFSPEDYDSFGYLKTAILENHIESRPHHISYMYPDTTIMLYHAARLYAMLPNAELFLPGKEIIEKLTLTLNRTQSTLKKLMLSSSLIKMGVAVKPIIYKLSRLEKEFDHFGFFRAPMLKGTQNLVLNRLSQKAIFHLLFDCKAYYYTLALEYEILINQSIISRAQ